MWGRVALAEGVGNGTGGGGYREETPQKGKMFIRFSPSSLGWPKHLGLEAPPQSQNLLSLFRFLPPHNCLHFARCLHRGEARKGKPRRAVRRHSEKEQQIQPGPLRAWDHFPSASAWKKQLYVCVSTCPQTQAHRVEWRHEGRVGSLPLSCQN